MCHDKLVALGFDGSDRTVRRAVAEAKASFRAGRRRVYRPWIVEPGMWAQWDWGHGSDDCRAGCELVLRVVGVVSAPGGDPDLGPDPADGHRLSGRVDATLGWGPDLLADRQRAHRHHRPRGWRRGAPSDDRGRRAALRGHHRNLRPGGPGVQGRLGSDRADRQGRFRRSLLAILVEPAEEVLELDHGVCSDSSVTSREGGLAHDRLGDSSVGTLAFPGSRLRPEQASHDPWANPAIHRFHIQVT